MGFCKDKSNSRSLFVSSDILREKAVYPKIVFENVGVNLFAKSNYTWNNIACSLHHLTNVYDMH